MKGHHSKSVSSRRLEFERLRNLDDVLIDIEQRAYEIYLSRVGAHKPGNSKHDWTEAEREILNGRGLHAHRFIVHLRHLIHHNAPRGLL